MASLMDLLNPICLSYNVLNFWTVLELTISSGKAFHLFIDLTQNEFILKVLKALGFNNSFEFPRVCVSENSNKPSMEMSSILHNLKHGSYPFGFFGTIRFGGVFCCCFFFSFFFFLFFFFKI